MKKMTDTTDHALSSTRVIAADHTHGWTSCLNRLEAMFARPR
jgi:hypothetical protein